MVGFSIFYQLLMVLLVTFKYDGNIDSFDGLNHLFDIFPAVLRNALSHLFFFFFL
jgi:hypothetical protein